MSEVSEPARAKRSSWTAFPHQVRLWHFVILPAAAMALTLLLARLAEAWLAPLGPSATSLFQASRTVAISAVMASLIGWLAFRYRTQYELQLQERNKDLEETRDFLSSVIEGSGEAIITLDEKNRVTSWNHAAEGIYGWTATEMLGQKIYRILPDDQEDQRRAREVDERVRSGETVRDFETTRIRKDGAPILVRMCRSPLYDSGGRFVGSVSIILDVTAESRMKSRLLERERLAAVGELAAQVAHEVRNPLAGIRGACEVMFAGYGESDASKEVAREVLQQIDRLNGTVEELLVFARPQPLQRASTDLHGLVDRVLGMVREDPKSNRVEVERSYARDLPPVEVDPGMMEQVFFNIFLNAVQAMDYRGKLSVSTAFRNGEVTVTVRDSGPGIPPDTIENIFKPFFTTRARGTGLGLAIVKKIILAHDGTVDASTIPGGGAEFSIRLRTAGAPALN